MGVGWKFIIVHQMCVLIDDQLIIDHQLVYYKTGDNGTNIHLQNELDGRQDMK